MDKSFRKCQDRENARRLIDSLGTSAERESWTWEFLERGDFGHKIRREIYCEIIFPVLEHGFHEGDFRCTFWLARTITNLHDNRDLHARIGSLGEHELLRRAFAMRPQDEDLRRRLLRDVLRWMGYWAHEWPSGILYGSGGASMEECEEIARNVAFGRGLDTTGEHSGAFEEFESKLAQYQEQLKARG